MNIKEKISVFLENPENTVRLKFYLFPALVLSYISIILIFELSGFFTKEPETISRLYSRNVLIEGTLTDRPQVKKNRVEFIVRSDKIDGRGADIRFLARHYNSKKPPLNSALPGMPDIEKLKPGDTIVFQGRVIKPFSGIYPNGFNYGKYLARKNIYAVVNIKQFISCQQGKQGFLSATISSLNSRMSGSIEKHMDDREASILVKMFIGNTGSFLPEDIKDSFMNAGVMHVLVVSGLNVGYMVAIFFFLFKFLPVPNLVRKILLIPVVIIYALVTGADPPITRATVMMLAVIICYILNRERVIYHAFALAAFVILLFDPQSLFSASFQLSFAACLGIVYIYPKLAPLAKNLPGVLKWLSYLFFVTFAAQLGVLPLLAYYFSKISLVSLVANIFIVPFSGIILWLCFSLFFADVLLPFAAPALGKVCSLSAKTMLYLVDFFASVPYAALKTPSPGIAAIIIYYLLLITFFEFFNRWYSRRLKASEITAKELF